MAKVLTCQHLDIECEYICANNEGELLKKAGQISGKGAETGEIIRDFEERARRVMQEVEYCQRSGSGTMPFIEKKKG